MDSLIKVFPKEKDDSAKGLIALNIARLKMGSAQNTGNWDEAIEWAHKGLFYSKKGNFKYGVGRCNWQLGRCWMLKGNYPEAIKYFKEALQVSFKNNNPTLTVVACNLLCECYMLLGNYQEALKNLQIGLKTVGGENSQNVYDKESLQGGLILKIGDLYVKLNNFSQAVNSYEKLLGDDQFDSTGEIHARIALAQIGMKNYDGALKNLQIAVQRYPKLLNLQPEIEYKGILGSFLLQIGEAYCKIGSIQQGDERVHSYNEAIKYLNKSLPLLTEGAGGKETLMNTYALLKEACEATNDYKNALHFTTLYIGLRDSMYNKTTYLKLADLQVKYETEKAATEMQAEQEKEKIKEDAINAGLMADQKLQQEKILADDKIAHEQEIAGQKLEQEKKIAGEKARYEKLKAEKQQMNNLLLMGMILVMMTSVFVILFLRQRNQKKRAVEKAEAIHKMAELEMQSLRSQLNPHFMFNSLNSIQSLILKEDADKSQSYLSRFARLLRMLLENADAPFIPLRKEIDFLQLYLSLETLRVPDLQYSVSTDPAVNTDQTLIPNMFLQPYVENAIWHGLSHKATDKQLQIRISRENGTVNYEIEDNGVGRKKSGELKSLFRKQHVSKGMELLSKRITLLNNEYNSAIQTEITDVMKNDEVAGTLVSIKIPVTLTEASQN